MRLARQLWGGCLEDALNARIEQVRSGWTEVVTAQFLVERVKTVAIEQPGVGLIVPKCLVDFCVDRVALRAVEFAPTLLVELVNARIRWNDSSAVASSTRELGYRVVELRDDT